MSEERTEGTRRYAKAPTCWSCNITLTLVHASYFHEDFHKIYGGFICLTCGDTYSALLRDGSWSIGKVRDIKHYARIAEHSTMLATPAYIKKLLGE